MRVDFVFWIALLALIQHVVGDETPLTPNAIAQRVVIAEVDLQVPSLAEVSEFAFVEARKHGLALNLIAAVSPTELRPSSLRARNLTIREMLEKFGVNAGWEVQEEPYALVLRKIGAGPLPQLPIRPEPQFAWIRDRLDKTIFPRIDLNQCTVHEAFDFIRLQARELAPNKESVKIVLNFPAQKDDIPQPQRPAAAPIPSRRPEPAPHTVGGESVRRITMRASNVPLREVIRYAAALADLPVTIGTTQVVIGPAR